MKPGCYFVDDQRRDVPRLSPVALALPKFVGLPGSAVAQVRFWNVPHEEMWEFTYGQLVDVPDNGHGAFAITIAVAGRRSVVRITAHPSDTKAVRLTSRNGEVIDDLIVATGIDPEITSSGRDGFESWAVASKAAVARIASACVLGLRTQAEADASPVSEFFDDEQAGTATIVTAEGEIRLRWVAPAAPESPDAKVLGRVTFHAPGPVPGWPDRLSEDELQALLRSLTAEVMF